MKTYFRNSWILLTCFLEAVGCSKKPTDFRSYLDNMEIVYPGRVSNIQVLPGNGRLMLTWYPSPDPSITKYVVTWNSGADSVVLPANTHNTSDTVKCIISNLSEYSYTFFLYSYDAQGNRSVVTEIDNAQVYGNIYKAGLHNRLQDVSKPALLNPDGSATMYFLPSLDTINITTRIKYVNTGGDTTFAYLAPNSSSIDLPGLKPGTKILYQGSFIPSRKVIDTFYTLAYDTVPYVFVVCDKSLFSTVNLPNDLQAYDGSTFLARIWDGTMTPRDYPNVFHSSGNPPLPGTVTFDMGKTYNSLGRMEEIGRTQAHNPSDIEIWGIADTTGAISALRGDNSGWPGDVQAKGWTKLGEMIRSDDGINAFSIDLISNPPPVRFIILRFTKTVNNSSYVNLSQVTFWNRQ